VKRGVCSSEHIPNKIFPIFLLEASLKFSIGCFDLSSFFLFRKKRRSASSTSRSVKIPKTEPLSPLAGASDFAYASDVAENNVCKQDMLWNFRFKFCTDYCNY
jgi:hypothetical protein